MRLSREVRTSRLYVAAGLRHWVTGAAAGRSLGWRNSLRKARSTRGESGDRLDLRQPRPQPPLNVRIVLTKDRP